jgi:hypothetical protein
MLFPEEKKHLDSCVKAIEESQISRAPSFCAAEALEEPTAENIFLLKKCCRVRRKGGNGPSAFHLLLCFE